MKHSHHSAPTLGHLLRRLRRERGLTQEQLASRAGLAQSAVSRIESGAAKDVRAETIKVLASGLGVPPEALMKGSGGRPLSPSMSPIVHNILNLVSGFPDEEDQLVVLRAAEAVEEQRKGRVRRQTSLDAPPLTVS